MTSSKSRSASIESIDENAEPPHLRHVPQDLFYQSAQPRSARKIGAITCEVDTGQHNLGVTGLDERADLIDDRAHRHRAGIAASEGNDAEGAAMIAAVLYLHKSAWQSALKAIDEMRRHLGHRHDIGHRDFLLGRDFHIRRG